jgi:hypothetical protein
MLMPCCLGSGCLAEIAAIGNACKDSPEPVGKVVSLAKMMEPPFGFDRLVGPSRHNS